MADMNERPATSKPRGICKYYRSSRGCLNGDSCKFLHGDDETLSPYDKSKLCKFYAAGFCKRGNKCWFRHVDPTNGGSSMEPVQSSNEEVRTDLEDEDGAATCSICQEKPVTYGLLEDCSHVFCLECIRGWRDPSGKSLEIVTSGNTKRCPYCRASSKFVTPSSIFYPSDDPMKAVTIANYKASMSRIPCKYFEKSPPGSRFCPFGKDCFYQHKELDGSDFVFERGADYYMSKRGRRRSRRADAYLVNLVATVQEYRPDLDLLQMAAEVRPDLRNRLERIEAAVSRARRSLRNAGQNISHTIRADIMERLHALDALTSSSEDDHVEEIQAVSSRPSILATPEDSTPTSALPLTRAFMDRNIPSEFDDTLTDAPESEDGEYNHDEAPTRSPFIQFRRYSLPNLTTLFDWTGELDASVRLARESDESSSADSEQESFDQSIYSHSNEMQENSPSPDPTVNNDLVVSSSDPSRMSSTEHLILSESPNDQQSFLDSEGTILSQSVSASGDESRSHDGELRRKPEMRSDFTPRRAKSSNNVSLCAGRRTGGQSFVTDGRGRVVATNDSAHADDTSLAFWSNPSSIVAQHFDSASETNEQAPVGLGPLDDLD